MLLEVKQPTNKQTNFSVFQLYMTLIMAIEVMKTGIMISNVAISIKTRT